MAAQMKDSSTKRKKFRSNFFLCCFGFSSEASEKKQKVPKNSQRFSWAAKKQSSRKADLIDIIGREIQVVKPDKKQPAKGALSSNHVRVGQPPAPVSDQVVNKTNKKRSDSAPEIITGERKSLSKSNKTVETATSQKGLTTTTKTTAPVVNSSTTTTTTKVLPQSESPPRPRRQKPVVSGGGAAVNGGGDSNNRSSNYGKVDGMVGMSVVVVTLFIMLVWGKLCAILCTSAWFYFVPRFAPARKYTANEESDHASELIDTNSEEYKKKVVLEGFLQRNYHRSTASGIM